METNANPLERELFAKLLELSAWKDLSRNDDFRWTEFQLEKYQDYLDWEKLCENAQINWTIEMIMKFKSKIHWKSLSEKIYSYRSRNAFDRELIQKFENNWDWSSLSRHVSNISIKDLEHFAHKWHWSALIDNSNINWDYEKYNLFKNYITIGNIVDFQRTSLWHDLVKIECSIIEAKLHTEKSK